MRRERGQTGNPEGVHCLGAWECMAGDGNEEVCEGQIMWSLECRAKS